MIKRQYLSRLHRTRIFDDAKGKCCICKTQIHTGQKWIVEHPIPLWLGGPDDDTNRRPAHYGCAVKKTAGEAPVKAKSDRIRANHLGIKKSSNRPLPGTRASGIRKRMDGTVERW